MLRRGTDLLATYADDRLQFFERVEAAVGDAFLDHRPQPFGRVQLRRVSRQRDQRQPLRHLETPRAVRRRAVEHYHETLARGCVLTGEGVEEALHQVGVEVRQHEPEDSPRRRVHGRIEPQPLVGGSGVRRGALTLRRPDTPRHRLEPEARFVLRPQLDHLLGVLSLHLRERVGELFLKAACSAAEAAPRWRGRGTWSVKPSRRMALHAVLASTGAPVRSAIQPATFGAVQSPPSAGTARNAASRACAASASRRDLRPGATSPRASGTASAPRSL